MTRRPRGVMPRGFVTKLRERDMVHWHARRRGVAALGRPLKAPEVVAVINGHPVICTLSYVGLLQQRRHVVQAGGNPATDAVCRRCGPLPIDRFTKRTTQYGVQPLCRACVTIVQRLRRAEIRARRSSHV